MRDGQYAPFRFIEKAPHDSTVNNCQRPCMKIDWRREPGTACPEGESVKLCSNAQAALSCLFLLVSGTLEDDPLRQRIEGADQDKQGQVEHCRKTTSFGFAYLRDGHSARNRNIHFARLNRATSSLQKGDGCEGG